jgi:molybdopterin-guanine dinucleotide biosynthesis protein A
MIKGLLLAGGMSTRMGRDKASLVYGGVSTLPIAVWLHGLLGKVCGQAYLSLRAGQRGFAGLDRIDDAGQGPAGALLAAYLHDPTATWLVLACDFPFVKEEALRFLASRGGAFKSNDGAVDPLFAVWEPRALAALEEDVARGQTSPRRILIRLGTKAWKCPWPEQVRNVNTAGEAAELAR